MGSLRVSMSDGAELYVELLGDDRKDKPLLIVLHGAPGLSSHQEPKSSFGFLQSRFRVLVYDARGSGVSDEKGPYTNERWAKDVDELREWAGAEKFVLAGGSYGGFVSLEYAIAYPDRLLALMLRDTTAYGLVSMMNILKMVLTSDRIKVDADRQVRLWSGNLRDDEDFAAAYEEIIPLYAPDPPKEKKPEDSSAEVQGEGRSPRKLILHAATQNAAFSYNMPRFDVRPLLKNISAPTLVLHGAKDLILPLESAKEISDGVPDGHLAVFYNSGHSPPKDEPEAFRASVKEFLSSIGL